MSFATQAAVIEERLDAALVRAGRRRDSVLLVAVSKTFPAETVAAAAREGLKVFGENRVQEAAAKIPRVARLLGPAASLSWHLVGHLQSNKANMAEGLFDLIHSVDDAALAARLDRAAAASGACQAVLIQVNVSGEGTKSGILPGDLRGLVDAVVKFQHLELRGLMTIPPYQPDPERSRPYFATLRGLGEKVGQWLQPCSYPGDLSMGMTDDFGVAVEEGATIIRLGRALFGERQAG